MTLSFTTAASTFSSALAQALALPRLSGGIAALALAALPLLGTSSLPSQQAVAAEPCIYQCSSNQIPFMPGQPLTI